VPRLKALRPGCREIIGTSKAAGIGPLLRVFTHYAIFIYKACGCLSFAKLRPSKSDEAARRMLNLFRPAIASGMLVQRPMMRLSRSLVSHRAVLIGSGSVIRLRMLR